MKADKDANDADLDSLRYPIGRFDRANFADHSDNLRTLSELPARLASAVAGLNDPQLDTQYRPEGWTLRQTVHHVADSHMNAYCRFKLSATEDRPPTIVPYMEDRWSELADSAMPVDVSLRLLEALHARWTEFLSPLSAQQLERSYLHPESGEWKLKEAAALYAWHSLHHTAHITRTRERHGW